MANFRQTLSKMLTTAADTAIEKRDQQYGRQLATLCERLALRLRASLGGKTVLEPRARKAPNSPRARPEPPVDTTPVWAVRCTLCVKTYQCRVERPPIRCPICQDYGVSAVPA